MAPYKGKKGTSTKCQDCGTWYKSSQYWCKWCNKALPTTYANTYQWQWWNKSEEKSDDINYLLTQLQSHVGKDHPSYAQVVALQETCQKTNVKEEPQSEADQCRVLGQRAQSAEQNVANAQKQFDELNTQKQDLDVKIAEAEATLNQEQSKHQQILADLKKALLDNTASRAQEAGSLQQVVSALPEWKGKDKEMLKGLFSKHVDAAYQAFRKEAMELPAEEAKDEDMGASSAPLQPDAKPPDLQDAAKLEEQAHAMQAMQAKLDEQERKMQAWHQAFAENIKVVEDDDQRKQIEALQRESFANFTSTKREGSRGPERERG